MVDFQHRILISNLPTVAAPSEETSKIDKSAKDFESLLLGSWLQEAEHSFAKVPGTDEEGDDDSTAEMQEGLAMQPLGVAMAASGGIGIARMISSQFHKTSEIGTNADADLKLNKSSQVPIFRVLP